MLERHGACTVSPALSLEPITTRLPGPSGNSLGHGITAPDTTILTRAGSLVRTRSDSLPVAAGVLCVISYTVVMRTHEIGIRMALGARSQQILRMVVGTGIRLILAGIAIGLFVSYFLTRLLSSQIWGVSTTDFSTYAGVAFLTLFVGILASGCGTEPDEL